MRAPTSIFLAVLFLLLTVTAPARGADAGSEPVKVVYHLADGIEQATRAMGNIRNHLRADPAARITVVANGDGIRFLLRDARDSNGRPFDAAVARLAEQGVEFKACGNTLTAHRIDPKELIPEARIVLSGVVEAARLQAKEGFVYLRP